MKIIQEFVISLLKNKPEEFDFNNIDFERVIKFFKKNKVSLIELLNNKHHKVFNIFFDSPEFKKAYQIEFQHYTDWRNDFMEIKDKWDNEEIDYIFHKSTGQFPYMSDNLDVIFRTQDFMRAGEILREIGYVNLRNIQEAHKEFYRKFEGERVVVPIHLHERVCWAVPFENIEHLWENFQISSEDKTVHFPCYEDGLIINTAHCFLEDHEVKLKDLLYIKKCIDAKELDWDYILKTAEEMYWLDSMCTAFLMFNYLYINFFKEELFPQKIIEKSNEYISNKRWLRRKLDKILTKNVGLPFKIPHLWTRIHTSLRELRDPLFGTKMQRYNQILFGLADRFIHLKLGVNSHPNMFITFSGLDGSGKTKHIEVLRHNFKVCDITSYYIWSRTGSLPIISLLLKIVRLFKFGTTEKSKILQKKEEYQLPKNSFTKKVWRLINITDMIFFYFFKVKIQLIFGKAVIADRYIYDSIVDLESIEDSQNFDRFLYKILEGLTPKPDIAFFIDIYTQTIIQRGSDEIKDELEIKELYYKKIITKMNAVLIDNSIAFDEVSEKICNIALSKFFEKYPEKYDGYKLVSLKYK